MTKRGEIETTNALITHPVALLAVKMLVPVLFLNLEKWTGWKVFEVLPPIVWIFLFPVVLSGFKIIPASSPTYTTFKAFGAPMFIFLLYVPVLFMCKRWAEPFAGFTGAQADITQAATAPFFLIAGVITMATHAVFCVLGAKLFRVDAHLTAIASAANIGGAASSPIVARHHRPKLVPVAILLALFGYAIGDYLGWFAAVLCRLVL